MNRILSRILWNIAVAAVLLVSAEHEAYAIPTISVALTASSSNVKAGDVVIFTATVTAGTGGTPYPNGYVSFCDATATYCEGTAFLGSTEVSLTGTAALKLRLGIGTHSIKAMYGVRPGAPNLVSSPVTVSVTGQSPTATVLSGTASSLSATVGYFGLAPITSGENVSFVDTTNNNLQLGSVPLGAAIAPLYGFTTGTGSPFNSGAVPVAIATGDFNDDGTPDLAVANYEANTVSVYTGSSNSFTAVGNPIPVGNGPVAITVADVNRDGFADLIVLNTNDATVSVLLGDGSGSFALAATVNTGGYGPASLVVFDADLDGNPDILVVNELSSTLSVLNGDGAGHFSTANAPIPTGGNPSALVAADFDADGIEDIAFTNSYDSTVSVWLGQGDGTFAPMTGSPFAVPSTSSANSIPSSLAVGDFDGDGRPDLAIVDAVNNRVSILLNPISGMSFVTGASATGASPASIVVGDFNGDGKMDLALANANDSTVTVLEGDGTGHFNASAKSPLPNFNAPLSIAMLDIDGDGLEDLAIANVGSGSTSLRQQSVVQQATVTLSPAQVYGGGAHLVRANYGGDTAYAASSSPTVSVTGTMIPTTGSLGASPGTIIPPGTTIQLTDALTPESSYNYTATGTVTFKDGTATIGTGTVLNGQAVASLASLAPGTHTLTATYSGDANFSENVSTALSLTIQKLTPQLSLISSANPVILSGAVVFTAAVSSSGSPTGSVSFYDGTTLLGSSALQNGQASVSTSTLTAGTHSITATYSGDTSNASLTSTALSEIVQDFTIAPTGGGSGGTAPTQTISPGGTATYQLDFGTTANTVFPDPVTLSVSGVPAGATATLSPTSLPAGSTLGNVTLTVQVPQSTAQLEDKSHTGRSFASITLALLLLPISWRVLRSARQLRRMLMFSVTLACLFWGSAALSGCASHSNATPAHNYVLTITATSGSLTRSTTVNLTVQ